MTSVGKNIRILRKQKNMSQDELAEKLYVSRQTVSNYETGKTQPDIDSIVRIAEIMETDASFLIYGIPTSEERKKQCRKLIICFIITLILGIGVAILNYWANEWRYRFYDISLTLLSKDIMSPIFYIILGITAMQAAEVFFGAKPFKSDKSRKFRYLFIVLLSAYFMIVLPYLVQSLEATIKHYYAMKNRIDFSYSMGFSKFPVLDDIAMRLIFFVFKYNFLFVIFGIGFWATKKPLKDEEAKKG